MKKILSSFFTICTALLFGSVHAQQIGSWQVYPSYWNATQNLVVGAVVYSLCDGNLLAYDTEDTSVKTYNRLDDLNDVHISHIAYSEEAKRIILIYDNGNIDLMDENDNVLNLSSLKDKVMPNKTINDIYIYGSMAYLCMGFGIIEINMSEGTIQETYQLNTDVIGAGIIDGNMNIVTPDGAYKCSLEDNMHDMKNWSKFNEVTKFDKVVCFQDQLIGLRTWNKAIVAIKQNGSFPTLDSQDKYSFLYVSGNQLLYGNSQVVRVCGNIEKPTSINIENSWNCISHANGTYWVSDGVNGLKGFKISDNSFVQTDGPIQPNSPKEDLCYRMQWVGDRLLVAGGINTVAAIYNNPTAMYYENGKWTNFQETDGEAYSDFRLANTTHLVQDPNDENHHFASLHRNGLCEYRNGKFVKLYNCDNSPIRSILPDNAKYFNYCSTSGLQYDGDRNLWMLNSETDTIVRVRTNSGKWIGLYYGEIANVSLCDDYLIHSSGLMFLNSRRTDNHGFFCFDTNGTLENTRDDRHILRSSITNQDGTSYSPDEFYCMAEDLNGMIWCGTNLGVFVVADPSTFFDSDFHFEQIKIARNDGSGLADYLLNGVAISCIAVDGANRKWIGTHSNGLYLISADGTEMIQHFTTEDSPILSNTIYCIAVHPTSGTVMIGTDAGLCSYVSDATEAAEELISDNVLVYPNPVRPDYTGPIAIKGLTMDSEVKILSTTGQLVWMGTSAGGTCTWNGTNKQGRRVASGVYHVVANNAEGKKAIVSRIIVIR
ncbi:MAG: regulator [Bacteroidaceae bacterium]|nr:regulator [Bacteroidaceae bacterium]